MFLHAGSAGILIFGSKDVIKPLLKGGHYPFMGKNRDVPLFKEIRSYIIQAYGVITVFMGKKNGIKPVHIVRQHLLPKIGPAIHHNVEAINLDKHRNT